MAEHEHAPRRRMSRSIGLVLVGTAALMLGMPGCDDHKDDGGNAATQPSSGHRAAHGVGYYGAGRGSGAGSGSSSSAHNSSTPRGGFGSTGHSVGS